MLLNIIKLIRPQQWLKNTFVFLSLFFHGSIFNFSEWSVCLIMFIAFSFIASSIYCFNDILDIKNDRKHPMKCKRPLACGTINRTTGYLLFITFLVLSFLVIFFGGGMHKWSEFSVVAIYFIINVLYTLKLKNVVLIDVFVIASGFVLRVIIGGVATGIALSHWIILITFLLALFLAFAKRRDDVVIYQQTGLKVRKNIEKYNLDFMNQILILISTVSLVCYIAYSVSEEVTSRLHCQYVYITSIFVLAGIIRYLQRTVVDFQSGNPTKILMKDHFIQLCIVGWIVSFSIMIYL